MSLRNNLVYKIVPNEYNEHLIGYTFKIIGISDNNSMILECIENPLLYIGTHVTWKDLELVV